MKKKALLSFAIFATTLFTACQSPTPENGEKETRIESKKTEEPKTKQVEIFVVGETATPKPQNSTIDMPKKIGVIEPINKVTIKSEVSGKVEKILYTEGQPIESEQPIIILGSSLNADIQDITFQNAIIALNNAQQQLTAKREANAKTLENSKLAIDQAAIQLETAYRSRSNLDHSTNLSFDHLVQQNQNSYYSVVEHARDIASLGRSALDQMSENTDYDYGKLESQVRYLEDSIYNANYYQNPDALNSLLNDSGNLLSDLKSYTSDTYIDYDYGYHYSSSYNDQYYQNRFIDSATYEEKTTSNASEAEFTAIQTRIGQLLPANTQYKSALLQFDQSIAKNDDSYINQATTADSQLALAEVQLENARQLFELRRVQHQLEEQQLQDQLDQLAGQVAIADRNRKTREIKSPISGTFITKFIEEGELLSPGQTIAEVGQINKLKVIIKTTQQEVAGLIPGQKVIVLTQNNEEIAGEIIKLPISFNSQTKTGSIEIEITNDPIKFMPGMIVNVIFTTPRNETPEEINEKTKKGIWIPLSTVYFNDNNYVFLAKNDKAQKQTIETGAIAGNLIEVKSGLEKNNQVITNRFEIEEGIKIKTK